jgi:hypothetical protein
VHLHGHLAHGVVDGDRAGEQHPTRSLGGRIEAQPGLQQHGLGSRQQLGLTGGLGQPHLARERRARAADVMVGGPIRGEESREAKRQRQRDDHRPNK